MLTEMKKYITIISVLAAGLVAFTACKKDKEIVGTNDTEGFFINRTELALNKGTTGNLVATVTPKGAAQVSWSSENEAVATVSAEGLVTAVGAGETVITAKAGVNSLKCKVYVTSLVTSVALDKTEEEIWYGEELQLTATASPDDINVPMDTTWTSSNESVVTVSDKGLVKAVGGGQASVVVAINGVSAKCEFNVRRNAEGIVITPEQADVPANRTVQFSAALIPADCTEALDFEWSVEDDTYATVDANGLVTGIAAGETKVIVKAGEFSASAKLTVKREPQSVTITTTSINNFTEGDVTFTFNGGVKWGGTRYGVEFHTGSGVTISVPSGFKITKITFTNTYGSRDFSVDKGTYSRSGSNHTWTPTSDTNSVTFTNNNSEIDVLKFAINYE